MMLPPIAKQIRINGIVQGVGFRPYIHQLARRCGLKGRVANTATGVLLHVEGAVRDMDAFRDALRREAPPLAHIVALEVTDAEVEGYTDFNIAPSGPAEQRATLISPDAAVCRDCLREMFDPADRRFRYPFINCTNCGPRYTIIDDIPYDRPKTTMRAFTMCAACRAEYNDPENRRFHAQPNACPQCGPRVTLYNNQGRPMSEADPIAAAARMLRAGRIVAVKGLGGFHLAVDALQDEAVACLRQRKVREEKPLAVMSPDLETIAGFARLDDASGHLLTAVQRPIVLLPKRLPEKLAFSVAPRNLYYGVMLPYTPLHYLLLEKDFTALVMTSGNRSEEPIAIDNQDAFDRLGAIADYFLAHDRGINLRSDDSVMRIVDNAPTVLRRSRGYVPIPVFLRREMPPVVACGPELKNTVCLTRGNQAFISQHIGDLENIATEAFFEKTIDHLQRILDIRPQVLACDRHPDYLSTQWALQQQGPLIRVQHHHAHVAACMAEHQLEGPVIGLAFDGTGLGNDGTVWGGEVLLADEAGCRRLAHLEQVPMPGSSAAIKSPWRMGLAYLHHVYGEAAGDLDLPFLERLDNTQKTTIFQMAAKSINAPLTSSLGRLFDGVAAILGLRNQVAFEGQAAMELEMIADGREQETYPFEWEDGPVKQLALAPIIIGMVQDIHKGVPAFVISRKFHQTIISMFAELCAGISRELNVDRIALSGGCFQNILLLQGLTRALKARRMNVFAHRQAPANDGGISLGQAVVAGAITAGIQSEV
jgi:hydrogenase maturation protein HypF